MVGIKARAEDHPVVRSTWTSDAGISLVEVMIALFLLSIAMLAIGSAAFSGLFSLRFSTDTTTAAALATRAVESSRNLQWSELSLDTEVHEAICGDPVDIDRAATISEVVLCEDAAGIAEQLPFWGSDGQFNIETYVTAVPGFGNAKRVTSVVRWNDRGESRDFRTSTVISEVARG